MTFIVGTATSTSFTNKSGKMSSQNSSELVWKYNWYYSQNYTILPQLLTCFGLFLDDKFTHTMYNTGAFIAGGSLTHCIINDIHNTSVPMPETSDLDIWISVPNLEFKDIEKDEYLLECERHSLRVFKNFIINLWKEYLSENEYILLSNNDKDANSYNNTLFNGHGDIPITVNTFFNRELSRKIQIIMAHSPVRKIVGLFDLSLVRHYIFLDSDGCYYLNSKQDAIQNIKEKNFTSHQSGKDLEKRIAKYVSRYGYTYLGIHC